MTAVVTDVHYRMALAVIRDLGERGVRVVCCERAGQGAAVGFASRYCAEACTLPAEGYANALYALCRELYEAEGEKPALLPVGAGTLAALTEPENTQRFENVAGTLLPDRAALDTLNDKEAVARLAGELHIPVPEAYTPETARFPCAVKPRCGEKFGITASERYRICRDPAELAAARERFMALTGEEPLCQQVLPGDGLGCSVLAENGRVRRSICHRRVREYPVTGGPSSCCEAVEDDDLTAYAAALAVRTGFSGLFMAEFKLDGEGKPRLLEVNPRVWGTYPLTRAAKAGFSWEWFRLAWNRGNPDKPLPENAAGAKTGKRMAFAASDLLAAAGYWKAGQKKRALGAVGTFFDPRTADGVWEWRDLKPALRYYGSILKRGGR